MAVLEVKRSRISARARIRRLSTGLLCCALLPLPVLVFTTLRPLELQGGGFVLLIGGQWNGPASPSGLHGLDVPGAVAGESPNGARYAGPGPTHSRWLQLGSWSYAVTWFRGRRLR